MKRLKIKQEFLDNIKNGIKNFEIRKKDYGFKDWTKVELVSDKFIDTGGKMDGYTIYEEERLIVELKQDEMTAFEIGVKLGQRHWGLIDNYDGVNQSNYYKFDMLENVIEFLKDYFKQGDSLYWYDLRLVE